MAKRDDRDNIRNFLEVIWGDMVGNAVVGLPDKPGPKGVIDRFYNWKYPEELESIVDWAYEHRNEDVYVSPIMYGEKRNPKNGKVRRIPENALTSRTVYQDSDTCTPDRFRLHPSAHVTTSAGRFHDYWVLASPVPAVDAALASRKIAVAHRKDGSDPSSWSANKVLRVPFTTNSKHGFPEDVTVEYSGEVYDILDVLGAYDDIELEVIPDVHLPADVSFESPQDLPDYASALDKLPEGFDLEILTKDVPDGVDRSRMRWILLLDLFRTRTLDFEDVVSIAWHAPAAFKWRTDTRNIRGLIAEALKAEAQVAYETGEGISAPSPEEVSKAHSSGERESLLTDEERLLLGGMTNWLDRWHEWCKQRLGGAYNYAYSQLNGLSILSAAFSDSIFMRRGGSTENCNLFVMGIGDSGTGKTSAWKLWYEMMGELFPDDASWNIGSNASPSALQEKLIERNDKVTVFNADEAHGWFSQLQGTGAGQWTAGILEYLAQYYDGYVPPMLRTGNRDISGKSAHTYFLMHFMGTRKGKLALTNVLNESMILSGFLARFLFYYAEEREVTRESMEEQVGHAEQDTLGYDRMARQWAAEFADTKKKLFVRTKQKRSLIPWEEDAVKRISDMKWELWQRFENNHPKWELLEPMIRRIGPNTMRVATLLAVEEGSEKVTLNHALMAIKYAEEWVANAVIFVESVSESDWKRSCDEIINFIATKGSRSRREVVLRKFASRKGRELTEQINDLIAQGRLSEQNEKGGVKWLELKM